jgi:SET domain-containing protein
MTIEEARRERSTSAWTYVGTSEIHGKGLFAARNVAPGTCLGTYEGRRTRRNGRYVLWIEDESGDSIGIRGENEVRYVNHALDPNAEFEERHLFATRAIRAHEEITIHYGDDWLDVG